MRIASANFFHTRIVRKVLNELEVKFELACVPEPKESAQYILAHAIGRKTVSWFIFRDAPLQMYNCSLIHDNIVYTLTKLHNKCT